MRGFDAARTIARYKRELQRGLREFQSALLLPPSLGGLSAAPHARDHVARLRHLAVVWVVGGVVLTLVTSACVGLGLNFATSAFAFLIVIVLLSLLDSLVSSVVFSVVAFGCLNYFFTEPRFTFTVNDTQDLTALLAFVVTSLVVTALVRRLRTFAAFQREQAGLLDLTHDAIFVRDTRDVVTYWNHGAEQLYGWRPEETAGRVSHELLQAVFPAPLEEIQRTLQSTGRWEGEVFHTRRDGARLVVASRWSLQLDASGEPIGTLETNNDITERKRAAQALHRSQAAYLAEAQRLSLTGSFGWNASSGEVFWSDETFRIFGYDPSTRPSVDAVLARAHPDDLPLVRGEIERAAREARGFDFEHRLLMPDGGVKHLHVVAHTASDAAGGAQFVGAVMDITARKRTEEALRRSEQRYHNLFQAMAVSFFELDFSAVGDLLRELQASGVTDLRQHFIQNPETVRRFMRVTRIVEVNEQTVALFGRGSRLGLEGSVEPFWPQESTQAYAEAILSSLDRKRSYSVETPLRRVDGSVFDAHFTVWYSADDPTRGLGGVIDISERVKAQAMLQQVQADFAHAARVSMLGQLTASIAHEVNQPLTAIVANGEAGLRWLGRAEPDVAEVQELTRRIVADARRAADVIARIRAMAVRRAPEHAPIALDEVVGEALMFLRHEVQSRGVSVTHYPARTPARALADRTQLHQVIVNLTVNAMQAMAQAGSAERHIVIRTGVPDAATLSCTVEDSGPGIAPEHAQRLFESFFTTKEGGMGMGLPICRSIIEAHGGRIMAENADGGGARFIFTLPAAQ